MAGQVIPITDLASAGVILDAPSISLPPNGFSDVSNVRFNAGAVRKMEGELAISLTNCPTSGIKHLAYWQGPTNSYYIVVSESGVLATVYGWKTTALGTRITLGTMVTSAAANYSHTVFNGGFHFIINNGVDKPKYLADPAATNLQIATDASGNFTTHHLLYTVIPMDTTQPVLNFKMTSLNPSGTPVTINNNGNAAVDNTATPRVRTDTLTGALPGDTIRISLQTIPPIDVRCGVIKSFGNLLIAGDLTETAQASPYGVIRKLPGVIRTSDVAAPGNIPTSWNPFRRGANTADEFTLSGTGTVKDMAELPVLCIECIDVSV